MKLEGSLDAFSLPDMFQLLSFTRKSGGLHLVGDGSEGVVHFAAGKVTGGSADCSRQPLARRLVGSGAVGDRELSAAVSAAAAGEGVGVVRALLDAGAVDAEVLRQAAREQVVDSVFDLMRWKDGDFAFAVDEPNPDEVGVALTIESVLADVETRTAGWDAVCKVVPSSQSVLAMPVILGSEPDVSREEWSLLALVDGLRTVADLVELTASGQYAVVSALAALVQRGLLEVRDDDAPDDHVTVVTRRTGLLAPLEAYVPAATPAPTGARTTASASSPASVAAPAPTRAPAPTPDRELVRASAQGRQPMLGGAHVPGDVVPPRPEPYLPQRRAEYDEPQVVIEPGFQGGDQSGTAALATAADGPTTIERDPSVNRSLMLRLIAGVRGL